MTEERRPDGVREVRASEYSHRAARGALTRQDLEAAIQQAAEEKLAVNARQKQIEARLAEIRASIVGRGRLPPQQYRRLCDEQTELKNELRDNHALTADLNLRVQRLYRDQNAVEKKDGLVETNSLLHKILLELEIMNDRRRAETESEE